MKVLHTSDWHLGKKLYKKDRHLEHEYFLEWLEQTIINEQIDILIVAGDVFDAPIPPTKSLKLYFDSLTRLSQVEHLKKIFIISGNHDSGRFLEAPLTLLEDKKVVLSGHIEQQNPSQHVCTIKDENGQDIHFILFPFFRSSDFYQVNLSQQERSNIEDLLKNQLETWIQNIEQSHQGTKVLIGHHLFGHYFSSGSEQTVSLSGLDSIPLELFDNWDILALGHIHKKQILRKHKPLAVYCGSPIPMRFSESNHKSVFIYHLHNDHDSQNDHIVSYDEKSIPVIRELIKLSCHEDNYQQVIDSINTQGQLPPYVELTLKLSQPNNQLIEHVKSEITQKDVILTNLIMELPDTDDEELGPSMSDIYQLSTDQLLSMYLGEQGCDDSEKIIAVFNQLKEIHEINGDVKQ